MSTIRSERPGAIAVLALVTAASGQPCQPTWLPANQGLLEQPSLSVRGFAAFDAGDGPALYVCGWGLPGFRAIFRWNGSGWIPVTDRQSGSYCMLSIDSGPARGLYVGGYVPAGAGSSALIRWDGRDTTGMGGPVMQSVYSMAVFDDGTGPSLYVGGMFEQFGGIAARGIVKWDGTHFSPLGSGLGSDGGVQALAVFNDGSGPALYAGGQFVTSTTPPWPGIAKWDGYQWSGVGNGEVWNIKALATYTDRTGTALYAGGFFSVAGGVPCAHIARWDGSGWSALGSGTNGTVYSLSVFDDGSGSALYVGGNFTTAGGIPAASIAKWNGSWSSVSGGVSGFGPAVYAMSPFTNAQGSSLFVGGSFLYANGTASQSLARLNGCPACYPNCDGSTGTSGPSLNAADFQCFLNRFVAGDLYANCDASTAQPLLNTNDFQCFLDLFAAGCT